MCVCACVGHGLKVVSLRHMKFLSRFALPMYSMVWYIYIYGHDVDVIIALCTVIAVVYDVSRCK